MRVLAAGRESPSPETLREQCSTESATSRNTPPKRDRHRPEPVPVRGAPTAVAQCRPIYAAKPQRRPGIAQPRRAPLQGSGSALRDRKWGAGRSIQHCGLKRRHVLATAHGIARVCALHEMVQIARVAVNSAATGMVGRRGLAKAIPALGQKRQAPAGAGACLRSARRESPVSSGSRAAGRECPASKRSAARVADPRSGGADGAGVCPVFDLPGAVVLLGGLAAVVVDAGGGCGPNLVAASAPEQGQGEKDGEESDQDPARTAVEVGGAGHQVAKPLAIWLRDTSPTSHRRTLAGQSQPSAVGF